MLLFHLLHRCTWTQNTFLKQKLNVLGENNLLETDVALLVKRNAQSFQKYTKAIEKKNHFV